MAGTRNARPLSPSTTAFGGGPPPRAGEDQSAMVSNSQSWKMRTARLDRPVRRDANQ
jgi:hypothetical protein